MDLRLRIDAAGHRARDLFVQIDGGRQVADLADALADRFDVPNGEGRMGLYRRRQNAWLEPDSRVADVHFRDGEELVLAPAASALASRGHGPTTATLLVTGGPCAGLSFPLPPGEHQVGRSPECDIVIDDGAISRVHMLLSVRATGTVIASDARSRNGIYVNGRRVDGQIPLPPGQELELGRSLVRLASRANGAAPKPDGTGRISLNRPPRSAPESPQLQFEVEPPQSSARSAAFSITSALLPLLMGVVLWQMTHQLMMLAFTMLSPLMVVGSFVEQIVGNKREDRLAQKRFRDEVMAVSQEMSSAYRNINHYRRQLSPDLSMLAERATTVSPKLWERRAGQADYLLLRVGWGDQESGVRLDVGEGGPERIRAQAMAVVKHYSKVPASPLSLPLAELGSIGLAGPREGILGMARSLVLQVALGHSPKDVMLVAATSAADARQWRWLGWLPHVHPEAPPVQGDPIVDSRVAARDLLDRLVDLLDERRSTKDGGYGEGKVRTPAVVALLDGEAGLPRGGVDRLLREGPEYGLHVIWLGSGTTDLPGDVAAVVELAPRTFAPRIRLHGAAQGVDGIGSDLAPLQVAEDTALALAAIRDVEASAGSAEIPRYVSLLELLELTGSPVDRIIQRWRHDDGRLAGRMGMQAGGEIAEVSMRNDGPHALAGGMTGAGKSELLQTFVASLAAAHSPERVTFILVDYKGGAAFKDCVHLPHTVGFVTDLDGHLVNRALTSLRAELRRREEVLREGGYKDLIDFEEKDLAHAFPSLLIVVDEFAALATDLPEFVDGMVDVAQRGRSLGIHLVLATQRPAGVINDKIRTNTNLRLSLRFSDDADSMDVIGTKDASRPGLPRGRAFARTGPGSLMEFQAAHASGRTPVEGGPAPIMIRELDLTGEPIEEKSGDKEQVGGQTDLQRVVAACQEANERLHIPAPLLPWLPTLPDVLPLESLGEHVPEDWAGRPIMPLGMADEPARQRQRVIGFGLEEDGNMLVYGGSRTGKTTVLRTVAAAAARKLSPDELHLYAIDYATRALRSLSSLPHCGGVIMGDEPERTLRLLAMLRREQDRRKTLFATHGASTLAEYHSMSDDRLPYVLVLLDGYSPFQAVFQDYDLGEPIDHLRLLVAEGRPLGMGFIVTADRSGAISAVMSSSINKRVILRMATDEEYAFLGLERSVYQDANLDPGRGFTEDGLEIQVPILGEVPGGGAQSARVDELGAALRERWPDARVPEVRLLPTELPASTLPTPEHPMEAVIGLLDGDLAPARVDLDEGNFLILGPRRSGRSTALGAFARSLLRVPPEERPPLFVFAPRRQSPLATLEGAADVAVGAEACAELATRLLAAVNGSDGDIDLSRGAVVLLDDGEEVLDSGPSDELDQIVREGRDRGVRAVAAVETQAAHRAFGGWFMGVQRDRQGFLLDPDITLDGALVGGVRLPRLRSKLPMGRGFLVMAGAVTTIQAARPD
jgi:S-DNA-T family DNA segregation ATPase FtsK/SpoIIIE